MKLENNGKELALWLKAPSAPANRRQALKSIKAQVLPLRIELARDYRPSGRELKFIDQAIRLVRDRSGQVRISKKAS